MTRHVYGLSDTLAPACMPSLPRSLALGLEGTPDSFLVFWLVSRLGLPASPACGLWWVHVVAWRVCVADDKIAQQAQLVKDNRLGKG